MKRRDVLPYVSFVVDDALNGRRIGADPHAVVTDKSVLVGWQAGFQPVFVAVNSYLGGVVDLDEAVELATDYLEEIGWFSDGPCEPDHVLGADVLNI